SICWYCRRWRGDMESLRRDEAERRPKSEAERPLCAFNAGDGLGLLAFGVTQFVNLDNRWDVFCARPRRWPQYLRVSHIWVSSRARGWFFPRRQPIWEYLPAISVFLSPEFFGR